MNYKSQKFSQHFLIANTKSSDRCRKNLLKFTLKLSTTDTIVMSSLVIKSGQKPLGKHGIYKLASIE